METIAELEQLGYDTPIPVTNNRARHSTRTNLFQITTTEHDENAYDGVEEITIANLQKHDEHDEHEVERDHENKSERSFKSGHHDKISWMFDHSLHDEDNRLSRHDINAIVGGNTASRTMAQAVDAVFGALMINEKLTTYYFKGKSNHEKCHSISAIAAHLESTRLEIVTAILDVTRQTGAIARDKILIAHDMLKNDGRSHRMVTEAILAFVWTQHKKSALRDQFRSILQDYALAATQDEVDLLLKTCSQGHTMNYLCPESMIDVDLLPGVTRLTLTASMDRDDFNVVVKHWRDLFQCMANFVCEEDVAKPHVSHLDKLLREFDITRGGYATTEDIVRHIFSKPHQSIQAVASQIHQAYLLIDAHARREGQPMRIPSANARKKTLILVIRIAHDRVFKRMQTLIDNNDVDVDTMSYEDFLLFVFKADKQPSARSTIMSFAMTMIPVIPVTLSKPTKDKDAKTDMSDKDKAEKKDQIPPERPCYMTQGPYIYELLVGPGVRATDQERAAATAQGKCSNCLGWKSKKYPSHKANQCPYTVPTGLPRLSTTVHNPISQTDGKIAYVSDATIISAALHDRKLLLSNGSPTGGKGAGKGGAPSIPKERTITFQPMRIDPGVCDTIDDDHIAVPDEVSHAPLTMQPSAWMSSAQLFTCGLSQCERRCCCTPARRVRTVPPMEDVMSYPTTIHYVDDDVFLTPANMPELRSRFAYERDRLTTRAIQLGVTPDTLLEALYRIPDKYLADILASYENDCVRSELVRTATVCETANHEMFVSMLETGIIEPQPPPRWELPDPQLRLDLRHLNAPKEESDYEGEDCDSIGVAGAQKDEPPPKARKFYPISATQDDSDDDDTPSWYKDLPQKTAPTTIVHEQQRDNNSVDMFLVALYGQITAGSDTYTELTGKQGQFTAGVDTYAELTVIRKSALATLTPCPDIKPSPIRLQGVGGHSKSCGFIQIAVTLQHGWIPVHLSVYILDDAAMPDGVDILFGVDTQQLIGMDIDSANHVIYCHAFGGEIFLDALEAINRRRQCPPLTILASCSGGSFIYCTFTNLGYTISKWYAIEIDESCIQIASKLIPPDIYVSLGNIFTCNIQDIHFDIHIASPPCQPWSRCQDNPLGFNDTRAKVFEACVTLHERAAFINPHIHFLVENVCHHPKLPDDLERMQHLWKCTPMTINAHTFGSPSNRTRLIFTNITTADDLKHRSRPTDPNKYLDSAEFYCPQGVIPCIVASLQTRNPPIVVHRHTGSRRFLSIHESEVAQGLPKGITDGFDLDRAQRLRIIGNSLNLWMTWAIMRNYCHPVNNQATPIRYLKVFHSTVNTSPTAFPATPAGAAAYTELLASFDDDLLTSYFTRQLTGFSMSQLHLEVKPGTGPMAKPKSAYPVASGLLEATHYAIDHQIAQGYMIEISHVSHKEWVSNCFVQAKPGRFWPDTEIQLVRLLVDLRALNAVLLPSPHHWAFACPDQASMCQVIPRGTKFMLTCDISNAFHTAIVEAGSRHLLTVQIAGRYLQYIGGPQGLANMALFWNPHLQDAFYAALMCHWKAFWTVFVDDMGVFGETERSVTQRARILDILLNVLDKPHSFGDSKDGTWKMPPQTSMILAGINVTPEGFTIADAQLDVLRYSLSEFKVKNKEDAQHVIGVINYCSCAFNLSSETWKLYSAAVNTLITMTNSVSTQKGKLSWDEPCKEACAYLQSLIHSAPRAMWRADSILDAAHSLAVLSDASDEAVSVCLFFVREPNANNITEDMLKDAHRSQLMATRICKLKPAQKNWAVWEKELWGQVLGVDTWGNYITTATASFPKNDETTKVAFFTDSTTALAKWQTLHLPEGPLSNACSKLRRILHWCDITSETQHWPMVVKYMPGEIISITHMMSHMAHLVQARIEMDAVLPKMMYPLRLSSQMFPAHVSSYYNDEITEALKPQNHAIPSHFLVSMMTFSADECKELQRAYVNDETPYISGVTIREIYAILTNITVPFEIHDLARKRIRGWENTLFFLTKVHGIDILLTQTSHQVVSQEMDARHETDLTNTLVLVVPVNAQIRVTSLDPICVDSPILSSTSIELSLNLHPADKDKDYMHDDLIHDLFLYVHQVAQHPSRAQTHKNFRYLAWIPNGFKRLNAFIDACSHCIPRDQPQAAIGNSTRVLQRFKVVTVDHKVFDADIKAASQHAGCLSAICNSSRIVMFAPVVNLTAAEAARVFYSEWIARYGVPEKIRSDNGSAFIANMMDAVRRIMGIKTWDFSCTNNPTHHALIEVRHKTLDNVLNTSANKGDLSQHTLRYYCAVAEQRHNHYTHRDNGITPFEIVTGETPRTPHNFMIVPTNAEISALDVAPIEREFICQLKEHIRDTIVWIHFCEEDDLHKKKAHRLTDSYNRRTKLFEHRRSDIVSYNGEVATIIELIQPTVTGPAKARIRITTHDNSTEKVVMYSDLFPIGIAYPELMIDSANLEIEDGAFCFFQISSSLTMTIVPGLIMSADSANQVCTIHRYEQLARPKNKFVPMWTTYSGKQGNTTSKNKNQTPEYTMVSYQDIVLTTKLDANGRLDDMILRSLHNQGIMP